MDVVPLVRVVLLKVTAAASVCTNRAVSRIYVSLFIFIQYRIVRGIQSNTQSKVYNGFSLGVAWQGVVVNIWSLYINSIGYKMVNFGLFSGIARVA